MNNVRAIQKLSHAELAAGTAGTRGSWHDQYRHSSLIYCGGLPYDLTEGDIIAVFSQYGEVLDIHLVRDKATGQSKGFCFLKYEDQRSTDLAVDNLNGIKLLQRTIRVDHVDRYARSDKELDPKELQKLTPKEQNDLARRRALEDLYGGNVAPELWGKTTEEAERALLEDDHGSNDDAHDSDADGLDPDDPMFEFLLAERKRAKKEERKRKKKEKRDRKKKDKDKDSKKRKRPAELDEDGENDRDDSRRRRRTSRSPRRTESTSAGPFASSLAVPIAQRASD
ncbi:hypothetical protein GGF31_001613 [Allomyces arbusculus]|nr:hypothetical protein GGF31_001613 [Allomyces arbusculus]